MIHTRAMAESKIEVGEKAPAFSLKNQNDETVKLSDAGLKNNEIEGIAAVERQG